MLCLVPNLDNGGLQRWEKISKLETDVDKFSVFFLQTSRKYFKRPVTENFTHFCEKGLGPFSFSWPNVYNNTHIVGTVSNALTVSFMVSRSPYRIYPAFIVLIESVKACRNYACFFYIA